MTRAGFAIDGDENEGIRRRQDAYPLKRTGKLDEASAAILFLASGEAGFVNGAALPMDDLANKRAERVNYVIVPS